jgi:hypothetical protein
VKWQTLADALKEALAEGSGEADPDAVIQATLDDVAETLAEEQAMGSGLQGLEELPGVQSHLLADFVWDGGGAPISSFLAIEAIRIGDSWFVYFSSDDFPSMVLERLDVLNRESATSAVERICAAGQYVNTSYRCAIEVSDLVDKERIEAQWADADRD